MIYIAFNNCENTPASQREAGVIARDRLFSFFDIADEVKRTENGKPYFKNFPDFNFNISHIDGAIAICFSDYPVGVDIEKIRTFNPKVTNRYFNETEKDYVLRNGKNTNKHFFEIWTKKEAYIKCYGLTLKELKNTNTSHIHTFQKGEYIISVCSECEKSKLIVLENINNI